MGNIMVPQLVWNDLAAQVQAIKAELDRLGRDTSGSKRVLVGPPGDIEQAKLESLKALRQELSAFEIRFNKTVAELRQQQTEFQEQFRHDADQFVSRY